MPIIHYVVWKDTYSVKVSILDRQHKKIIELINSLYTAIQENKQNNVLKKILFELQKYTITHFTTEEKYLIRAKYPDFKAHKKEHDSLKKRTIDFVRKSNAHTDDISLEVLNFLKNWWIHHITEIDSNYKPYMERVLKSYGKNRMASRV